jgi:hypothetical protein
MESEILTSFRLLVTSNNYYYKKKRKKNRSEEVDRNLQLNLTPVGCAAFAVVKERRGSLCNTL